MQRGSLMRVSRKEGPDIWQFRWSEKDLLGRRIYRRKVLGSVVRYADEAAALRGDCIPGRDQFREGLDEIALIDCRSSRRSFRATGTRKGQRMAQSRN